MMYFYICDYFGEFKISSRKLDEMLFECEEVMESVVNRRFEEFSVNGI